jgi:diketogulonate reductase-like aldo/keto reductase
MNEVIFGTWQLADGEVAYNAVSNALKAGYRHIDTAADYENEISVGEAIRDSGMPREEIFVTTKLSAMIKDVAAAKEAVEMSLNRLNIDYIDQLLIHAPRPWGEPTDNHYYTENRDIWQMLEEVAKSGRVKRIGLSNFDVCDVENILSVAEIRPSANQIKCHVGNYPRTLAEYCKQQGIALTGFSTLCTNYLMDKAEIHRYADKYGVTAAQLCIRYSLQHGFDPIVLSTNPEHIKSNLNVNFVIIDTDMAALDTLPGMISTRYGAPQAYEGK